MASKKKIFRIGNNLDPFAQVKLKDLPREANAIKNMTFDEWGNLCKRAGYTQWNTTSLSADHKITGLHRFYKQTESSKYCLVVCDTGIYVLAEAAGHAAGSSLATVTTDTDAYFVDFVDRCLIANGSQNLSKFNGTVVYSVGITAPSAPSVAVVADTGSLSVGAYYFKVTYVDEDGNESNASVASSVATIATAGQKVTVTPTVYTGSDYSISYINIYRTLADGASYYYDGQVANTTAITFSSTQSDTALVQANSLENYHGQDHTAPPSAPSLIAKRGGRIYLAKNQKLYYSKRFYEYFPAEYWIAVGNMRNITGIINQLHTLQVATKNSVERLLGTSAQIESADYFQFKDSYSSKGVYAPRSQVDCDNYIVLLNKDGLYVLNIDQVRPLNDILNAYLKTNMDQSYIDKSCATFYDGLHILSYPKSGAIGTITLNAGGTGYTALDVLTVVQSGGSSATVRVDTVSSGVIQTITLLFKGSGYTVANGLSTTGGTGTGGKINFTVANTVPSETVYYDFNNNTYGIFDFSFNVYSVWGQDGEDSLKAGSTTIGRVYDVFSGLDDDGAAIEAYDTEGFLYFGNSDTYKQFYNVYLKIKSTTATALRLYYTLDGISGVGTETYKDVTLTANKTKIYKVDLPSGVECRGIKLRPRMSDKYYWEIQGMDVVYRDSEPEWGSE